MRKITGGFLVFGYLFLALTIGAVIWRAGMGAGAGVAGALGMGGILAAVHGLVQGALERHALRLEISKVREAHRLLADAMESTQGALTELAQAIESNAIIKTDTLTGEVRMLEGLIHQMSDTIDERLTLPANAGEAEAAPAAPGNGLYGVIQDALGHNRVDLYLQPVVSLPQRRTHYYEAYTRLRDHDGRTLVPAEYLSVAEDEGLVSAIDNLLLIRCAQIVRRLHRSDRKVGIFCNISFDTLGDEDFFPQLHEFLGQNRDLSESLILELGQAAFEARGAVEARNMAKLADLGFRFSIDKVQTLDLNFSDLQRSDVRFIKVAADLLIEQLLEMDGAIPLPSQPDIQAADFAPLTRRHGLELIAEKVETEKQAVDILELDISVGQGHLFGEPRAIKENVLAETDPPVGFVQQQARRF